MPPTAKEGASYNAPLQNPLSTMKILCLHGNGTNSSIMMLQTAALRHELGPEFEWEFVEATLPAPMSEGVEELSSPNHSFYAYYDPANLSTLQDALHHLDNYVLAEGPFTAVMGFSAGAVLAAMYMLQKGKQNNPFACGIFLSSASSADEAKYLCLSHAKDTIGIPTVHVWGAKDATAPTGGTDLGCMCDPLLKLTHVHDGGHEMPRKEHLVAAAQKIRRALYSTS